MTTNYRTSAFAAFFGFFVLSPAANLYAGNEDHSAHGKHATELNGVAKVDDLSIEKAWTRQTPPNAKVAGGYLKVTNNGAKPDRLIGGKADFASRVEIHEMSVTDGIMRMAALENGLEIKPRETIHLKPGGYHLMFLGLTASPKEGETVSVVLTFEIAGDITVQMPVAAIGARSSQHDEMDHTGMNHGKSSETSD